MVLIVGGSSGHGHMMAAKNIACAFEYIDASIQTEIIDVFDYLPISLRFLLDDLWRYNSLYLQGFYRRFHDLIISSEIISEIIIKVYNVLSEFVVETLAIKKPKVFIATHPAAVIIGSILKKKIQYSFTCCIDGLCAS